MIVYIQKNYQQKLTISDIASAGNISRTKCCQYLKTALHSMQSLTNTLIIVP